MWSTDLADRLRENFYVSFLVWNHGIGAFFFFLFFLTFRNRNHSQVLKLSPPCDTILKSKFQLNSIGVHLNLNLSSLWHLDSELKSICFM